MKLLNIYKNDRKKGIYILTKRNRFFFASSFNSNYKYIITYCFISIWIKDFEISLNIPVYFKKTKQGIITKSLQKEINDLYETILTNQNHFGIPTVKIKKEK